MDNDSQKSKQSEEVDLGQLFKSIGNIFERLFKFVSRILFGLYKVILLILIHFYNRIYWYLVAGLAGLIIGFSIDYKSEELYGANMFIETNFNSARQVYENIRQFHQLASVDKDSIELSERLNITPYQASKIKGFYIEADLDENKIAKMYSDFYLKLDSVSRIDMTYDRYKKALNSYNYRTHKIGVASTDKMIYKKIEGAFINEIVGNDYLEDLVKSNAEILKRKDKSLEKQVKITDSLVNEYLKIRINESKKEQIQGSGTNLYMGDSESSNLIVDESSIIRSRLTYENARRNIDSLLVAEKNVINVLAKFPKSGYDIDKWHDKMKFVLPIVFLSLILIVFSFLSLGKYLKEETRK